MSVICINSAASHATYQQNRRVSPREAEVLALVADGLENKEIAAAMGLSPDTIRAFLRTASLKLGAHDRYEAVALWRESQGMERAA